VEVKTNRDFEDFVQLDSLEDIYDLDIDTCVYFATHAIESPAFDSIFFYIGRDHEGIPLLSYIEDYKNDEDWRRMYAKRMTVKELTDIHNKKLHIFSDKPLNSLQFILD
jgi:hypothetical protein